MPVNIYKRSYIVLNPEDKGCSFEGKEVSGYLKLEFRGNRGKVTAALQNLNPDYSYNLKLLKSNGDVTVVDFGALKVDDKGRGGGEWTFDLEDVKGSGLKWEEFSVILVEAHDGEKFLVPLASPMNKKSSNWKSAYRKYLIKRESEESETHKEETVEDKKVEVLPAPENVYEKIEAEEDVLKENLEEYNKREENKEEADYIKYLKEYVNNIVNFLEEVQPFEKNLEGYRWWKVKTGYREGSFDHYLVGFVKDEKGELKYIVYGMPGFFTLSDQPFAGMTGFVVWKPVREGFRGPRDEGYWLMHIDAKTGQIAVPIEPTPPPIIQN